MFSGSPIWFLEEKMQFREKWRKKRKNKEKREEKVALGNLP
jgi:hypothetical protein